MNSRRAQLMHFVFALLPVSSAFGPKRSLLRWAGARVGEDVRCASSARFLAGGAVTISHGTWIGHEALFIGGDAPITIGKDNDIGPQVSFVTGTHLPDPERRRAAGPGISLPITLGDGCWIGGVPAKLIRSLAKER